MSWDSLFTESLKRRRGFPYGSCCRLLMARKVGHGDLAQSRRALSPSDGITVDRYGAALLVTAYEPGHDPLRYAAQAPEGVTSLYYQPRYESGARKAPRLLWGPSVGPQVLTEGRLRFQVDLERGMNPGVFLDTRPLRALLQEGLLQGKRVLNLFSYTSTMGAAALLGGARGVTNVDSSGSALQRGQANYDLCGLRPSGRDFVKKDVFKKLTWYAKRGTSFDAVICDPPCYSRERKRSWASVGACGADKACAGEGRGAPHGLACRRGIPR